MRISDWSSDVCSSDLVLDVKGGDGLEVLRAANDIFGGNFLSRFNMNLRETKGWSYGVRTQVTGEKNRVSWIASAPVQADRTGDSIKELQSDLKAFLGDKGVTKEELDRKSTRLTSSHSCASRMP